MLCLLMFAVGLTSIAAQADQATLCECAVFAREDRPGNRSPILVGYLGTPEAPDSDCEADTIFDTNCYAACEQLGTTFKLGSGHCESHIYENRETCFGDVWCERISKENPGYIANGTWVISAYVSLRLCPDQDDIDFVEIDQPAGEQRVCCGEDYLVPCDEEDCQCEERTYNDCECGLFIPAMFGKFKPNPNVDPLPLSWVGTQFNSTDGDWNENCWRFPSAPGSPDSDFCTDYCLAQEDELVGYSLSEPHPNNPGYSYGEFMCAGLFAKVNRYEAFENEPIQIHGRVQNCPGAGIGWASETSFGQVEELLCCDQNGGYYACPISTEL